jgi:hypothetical protein
MILKTVTTQLAILGFLLILTKINALGSECVNILNNELYDLGNLRNATK